MKKQVVKCGAPLENKNAAKNKASAAEALFEGKTAKKLIPGKCPVTVRYQDGSVAPIYSLERDG